MTCHAEPQRGISLASRMGDPSLRLRPSIRMTRQKPLPKFGKIPSLPGLVVTRVQPGAPADQLPTQSGQRRSEEGRLARLVCQYHADAAPSFGCDDELQVV